MSEHNTHTLEWGKKMFFFYFLGQWPDTRVRTWDNEHLRDSHTQCVRVGKAGGGDSDSLQQVKTLFLLLLLY